MNVDVVRGTVFVDVIVVCLVEVFRGSVVFVGPIVRLLCGIGLCGTKGGKIVGFVIVGIGGVIGRPKV